MSAVPGSPLMTRATAQAGAVDAAVPPRPPLSRFALGRGFDLRRGAEILAARRAK